MDDFDDIKDLIDDLEYELLDISFNKLSDELKEAYKLEAEHSYTLYDPVHQGSRYRGGVHGSFADEEHHIVDVDITRGGIGLSLHNERRSDCQCEACRGKSPYLDTFIEEGIAGKYNITSKPVIENTYSRLDNEELVENILTSELKKRGYEMK